MYVGAEPVFADVRSDIWTVDPAAVEAAITERTVGIMAVDVFGQCADYDELRSIAERHGLWLLEDAAAATGARYRGRPAGSLADVACFSFHGRKGVTSGEGGALTTSRADIDANARKLHAFGIESALARVESDELPVPVFDELGYNYKLSDVAAAIMLVQLRRLPDLIARRQRVADAYATLLADVDGVTLPVCLDDRVHTWQAYVLTLAPEIDRSAVAFALRSEGIQCTFGTYASHVQPLYGDRKPCPTSADLFARQLAIPMHANLVDAQVERVAAAVRACVMHHRHAPPTLTRRRCPARRPSCSPVVRASSACMSCRCCWSVVTASVLFDNMFRGDRDAVAKLVAGGDVELVDQDVRYGGAVQRAVRGCESVVHFAAVSINKSLADTDESIDINMVGNQNVFAAAADEGVRRLVFASSASVYGDPDKLPMHEDDELHPLTPYCISKRAGEDLLAFYQRSKGLNWIALRFFNVYGPGQKTTAYYTSVINHFVNRLRAGEPPVIDGRGEQSMDFIHVDDCARATIAALEAEHGNVPVNIGTGIDTSVAQLAKVLIQAVGVDVEPQFNPRDVLVSRRAADITRARDVLGWAPAVSVEEGMAQLVRSGNA